MTVSATANKPFFTSGELGDLLGVQSWRIARLFEMGLIAEPARVGGRRMIHRSQLPEIVNALQQRGWLKPDEDQQNSNGPAAP